MLKSERDRRRFIRENTRLLPVALTPEIRLHLAEGSLDLWKKTEEELGEIGLPPPFWAFAWAGGQALARHVLDHPECVEGKTVIDFATGSGLVAIAASLAGAGSVLAADIDDFALQATHLNARANGVSVSTTSQDLLLQAPPPCDVLLIGDIFYDREIAAGVLAWARQAGATGSVVLIGDPGRSYLPADALVGLASYTVPVSRELEDREFKTTTVWALRQ